MGKYGVPTPRTMSLLRVPHLGETGCYHLHSYLTSPHHTHRHTHYFPVIVSSPGPNVAKESCQVSDSSVKIRAFQKSRRTSAGLLALYPPLRGKVPHHSPAESLAKPGEF